VLDFSAATGTGTFTAYNSGGVVGTPQSIAGAIISLPTNGTYFILT
jgi:hypothetical protein